MIWDAFLFFDELDTLEIRLHELSPVVDRFVLLESTRTFSNAEKPLVFAENKGRFKEFLPKIHHAIVTEEGMDGAPRDNAMAFDNWHKAELLRSVAAHDHDWVTVTDADEILRKEVFTRLRRSAWSRAGTELRLSSLYLNQVRSGEFVWPLAKVWRYREIVRQDYDAIRIRHTHEPHVIKDAGWHFTSMGNVAWKIASWGHQEWNRPPYNTQDHIDQCRLHCKDLFGRNDEWVREDDLSFLPQYVQDNQDRFQRLIAKP
jgi:beta-1,4-mannosyl-glycoprotein beta-1,4-N-acetylglucosaminyltransferase